MTALLLQPLQAYHAAEDRELGRPVQVDASPADSAGPWTVFWAQTAPQLLRFKVGPGCQVAARLAARCANTAGCGCPFLE